MTERRNDDTLTALTPTEVMDFLCRLEADHPVETWCVDGVEVWPLLRMQLYGRLYRLESAAPPVAGPRTLVDRLRLVAEDVGRAVLEDARARLGDRQRAARRGDAVFLTYSTSRSFPVGGRWYDINCQPIVELLAESGRTSILWEVAPKHEYRVPRAFPSRLIQSRLTGIGWASSIVPVAPLPCAGLDELAKRLARELELDVLPSLARGVRHARWLADDFKRSLARTGARLGLAVNYYDTTGMAFMLACRELGMLSVDIQHGVQGPLHAAYGRWERVPARGYGLLPSVFWTWSESDAETIRAWAGSGPHQALAGGNLLLAKFLGDDDATVRSFDEQLRPLIARGARNVLVTLQPGRGVPALLREAIVRSPASWRWWIRMHPSMMSERSDVEAAIAGVRDRVYLEEALLPLYALLRHVDVHATETSSVVLEAEHFGVPTILYHRDGVELYRDQIDTGIASFAGSAEALCEQARLRAPIGRRAPTAIDRAQLERFLRRTDDRLESILGRSRYRRAPRGRRGVLREARAREADAPR